MDDDLFAAPGAGHWNPVSKLLAKARITIGLVLAAVVAVAGVAVAILWWRVGVPVVVVAAVALAWLVWWAPRNARSWGWSEGPDVFAVRSGLMWRRMEVVPYGRIQVVEVQAGPVATHFGIATVEVRTASEHGATVLRGLLAADAAALRDRLLAVCEPWSSGV